MSDSSSDPSNDSKRVLGSFLRISGSGISSSVVSPSADEIVLVTRHYLSVNAQAKLTFVSIHVLKGR